MCVAPWLCGAWGAAWSSQQCQLEEERGASLAGWLSNPAGLPKPLLWADWHCWHCLPVETFGGFQFLGENPSRVAPSPAGTESCGTRPSQGHQGQTGQLLIAKCHITSQPWGWQLLPVPARCSSGLSWGEEAPHTHSQREQRPFSLPGEWHLKKQKLQR